MSEYLTAWMVYSRSAGPHQGAALVFAHNKREARIVGWSVCAMDFTDEFTDFAAGQLPQKPWLFDEADPAKMAGNEPHAIFSPKSCRECGMWGHGPIGDDGICPECRDGGRGD